MNGDDGDFFSGRGEVAALIRSKDWSRTPLGTPDTWPGSLRTVLRLMLASRYSMWLGWGPELTFLYNDAYADQTLGAKHPWALGRPASQVWAEIWDSLDIRIRHVLETGEATWDEGLLLFLERNGYPEETYHTFSYSPAPGDRPGETGGLFCVVIEETERVIGERRIALLRDFSSRLSQTKSIREVLEASDAALSAQPRDIPFALTWLFDDDGATARKAGSTNVPEGHHAGPEKVSTAECPWPLAAVRDADAPIVVALSADRPWPVGPWSRPPKQALVVPLADQGQSRPAGAFVAGLNPHRPLDPGLQSFVALYAAQLAAGLANARAYEEARSRAEALAELDRAKTTFFSNISHEFRTPLTLMLGPTEDALASPERALQGADLEAVHRNELRLLKLVNALLDFARIEAGRIHASYQPTDLAALTRDLSSAFRSAVERAGLTLRVDCDEVGEVYVDHDMWEKIVLNLLSNAFKFTFEGEIAVELRGAADDVSLRVRDTGVGIAAHELPRLFERFHRIEGARARTHEGSGIGLALVHDLVGLHGGSIDVRSEQGRGTEFTITVPRGHSHLPAERVRLDRVRPPRPAAAAYIEEALRWTWSSDAPAAVPPDAGEAARARIVVADDNADMRDYIARVLGERWRVEAVGDGESALRSIRAEPPALVLSDVMMPGLDGFGLLRALRNDRELRSIPVVLLSARAGEESAGEGLNAGADDYIAKPFTARDLMLRVASRIAAAEAARQANIIKENLYRHFMQAPFPVAVFRGPQHVVELANGATLRSWGRSEQEAIGRPLADVLPELREQPFLRYLDGVFTSGVAYEGRAESARLPAGPGGREEEAYFSFVYAPLLDARGAVEGVLMSAFDVTAQVQSHRQVEQARDRAEQLAGRLLQTGDRLRAAQRVARVGIFEWDLAANTVEWSPELYALMGLSPGSVAPTPDEWTARLFDESDREAGRSAFRDATARHASTFEVDVRLRRPDGSSQWVRISNEVQYDDKGAPVRLLGAAVDVQLLKEAAEARARALAEAERTGRAKDEFLATMSHELRTPLNAMLGWARILRQTPRDERKLDHGLRVIERNAETQARLISDLLDVSRIISGKLRLTVQVVTLAAVIGAAVDVIRQAAEGKGVRLDVELDPDLGTMVGDADRLQQVVWNLLSNAVKFTPTGGTVTVRSHRSDSSVTIAVTDTGIGIPAEQLPFIFERFHQVDSTTTRAHGGLGLGLAIARQLVEAHGGTVETHSEGPGRGATFTATLPLRAPFAEVPIEKAAPSQPALQNYDGDRTPGPLRGLAILVVDDDEDSLDLLRILLEDAGAAVSTASNAAAALKGSARQRFDVVVSDIGMPEMDGYAFMRALRTQHAEVRAIALTAYARVEDAKKARDAGYQQHLAKPVNAAELVAVIERVCAAAAD